MDEMYKICMILVISIILIDHECGFEEYCVDYDASRFTDLYTFE